MERGQATRCPEKRGAACFLLCFGNVSHIEGSTRLEEICALGTGAFGTVSLMFSSPLFGACLVTTQGDFSQEKRGGVRAKWV